MSDGETTAHRARASAKLRIDYELHYPARRSRCAYRSSARGGQHANVTASVCRRAFEKTVLSSRTSRTLTRALLARAASTWRRYRRRSPQARTRALAARAPRGGIRARARCPQAQAGARRNRRRLADDALTASAATPQRKRERRHPRLALRPAVAPALSSSTRAPDERWCTEPMVVLRGLESRSRSTATGLGPTRRSGYAPSRGAVCAGGADDASAASGSTPSTYHGMPSRADMSIAALAHPVRRSRAVRQACTHHMRELTQTREDDVQRGRLASAPTADRRLLGIERCHELLCVLRVVTCMS